MYLFFMPVYGYSADISLSGNDILLIENQTYSNKGNITLNDNAQLIIRNSTYNFEQDYHEQYNITLNDSSTFSIEQNAILTSEQRFTVHMNDSSSVSVNNSVALNESLSWKRGAFFLPNENSTFLSTSSHIDGVGDMGLYSDTSKATIEIVDSTMQAMSFHFPLNSNVNLNDIKIGLIESFELLKSATNLPYNLTVSNTIIESSLTAWIKDNAEVRFTNCEFLQIAVDEEASFYLIDSDVNELWIYPPSDNGTSGEGMIIQNLRSGYIDNLNIDLSDSASIFINISNTNVSSWCVKTAGYNQPLQILNSQLHWFRPMYSTSEITITDTTIEELLIWDFTGTLNFENTIVGNWYDTRNYPGYTNEFLIKGNVSFIEADLIAEIMGDQWLDTIVTREFPIQIQSQDTGETVIEIYDPDGNLAYSGNFDDTGNIITDALTFDSSNYDKAWGIKLFKDSELINEQDLMMYSSTPIILCGSEIAGDGIDNDCDGQIDEGYNCTSQGFDKEYYLAAKLAQLQAVDPAIWSSYTSAQLETLLASYGFTAETHYSQYGYLEGLAPNQYFNHSEYILAKATALCDAGLYATVELATAAFEAAWPGDAYLHYLADGAAEGLNPSNDFDESQYLTDKLAALQASGDWLGKTIDDLRSLLASVGMTALDHYLNYGWNEGLSVTPVPIDERVGE